MIPKYLKLPLFFHLFLFISGCATLPEYARPRMVPTNQERVSPSEGFAYQQLKIADFRALSLPQELGDHEKHIQAHSCIQIRPTKDAKFKVVPNNYHGKTFYYASIQHIAFEALMIPSCSWWNPRMPKKRTDYVLQHEQIHFAITELAARKLTHQVQEIAKTFLVIQPTRKQALDELSTRIKSLIKAATDESLKEHLAFDEDTSMIFNPKQQRWWLNKVKKAMREDQAK